jgi:hypothetical protein
LRFNADGVVSVFMFAGIAGEGRRTAVMNAGFQGNSGFTGRPRGDIARVQRVAKPIVKPNGAAGWAK